MADALISQFRYIMLTHEAYRYRIGIELSVSVEGKKICIVSVENGVLGLTLTLLVFHFAILGKFGMQLSKTKIFYKGNITPAHCVKSCH